MDKPQFDIYPGLERDIEAAVAESGAAENTGLGETVRDDIDALKKASRTNPSTEVVDWFGIETPEDLQDAFDGFASNASYEINDDAQKAEEQIREEGDRAEENILTNQTPTIQNALNEAQGLAEQGDFEGLNSLLRKHPAILPADEALIKRALDPIVLEQAKNSASTGDFSEAIKIINSNGTISQADRMHEVIDNILLDAVRRASSEATFDEAKQLIKDYASVAGEKRLRIVMDAYAFPFIQEIAENRSTRLELIGQYISTPQKIQKAMQVLGYA